MGGTWDSNKPSERVTLSRHQTYDETNPFDILCRQLEKRVTLSATYFLKKIICPDLAWLHTKHTCHTFMHAYMIHNDTYIYVHVHAWCTRVKLQTASHISGPPQVGTWNWGHQCHWSWRNISLSWQIGRCTQHGRSSSRCWVCTAADLKPWAGSSSQLSSLLSQKLRDCQRTTQGISWFSERLCPLVRHLVPAKLVFLPCELSSEAPFSEFLWFFFSALFRCQLTGQLAPPLALQTFCFLLCLLFLYIELTQRFISIIPCVGVPVVPRRSPTFMRPFLIWRTVLIVPFLLPPPLILLILLWSFLVWALPRPFLLCGSSPSTPSPSSSPPSRFLWFQI